MDRRDARGGARARGDGEVLRHLDHDRPLARLRGEPRERDAQGGQRGQHADRVQRVPADPQRRQRGVGRSPSLVRDRAAEEDLLEPELRPLTGQPPLGGGEMGLGRVELVLVQADLGEERVAPHRDPQPVDPVQVAECGLGRRGRVVERARPQRGEGGDGVVAGHGPPGAPGQRDLPPAAGGGPQGVEAVGLQRDQARDEPRLERVRVGGPGQLGPSGDQVGAVLRGGEPVGEEVEEAQHGFARHVPHDVAAPGRTTHGLLGGGAGALVVQRHEAGEGELAVGP